MEEATINTNEIHTPDHNTYDLALPGELSQRQIDEIHKRSQITYSEALVRITGNLPVEINDGSGWSLSSDFEKKPYRKYRVGPSADTKYPIVNILEEPEYCKIKVHYEADPDVVVGKVDGAVELCRKLQVPGFRKGKAPDHIIKVRLRSQINQYVVREMATQAIDDIVFDQNIKVIGQPNFSNFVIEKNKFSCDVDLSKKPEFTLSDIKFDVNKTKHDLTDDILVEKSLLDLQLRLGETEPYEENDVVEIGDQVTFSFTATIDGESFDGSVAEGEMYQIGSDRWVGFDNNLLGMKADETKEFEFKFDSGSESILGKTAKFSVTVHMGVKKKPHEIDEEFFKQLGVQNLEELNGKLLSISKASITRTEQNDIRSQVAEKLIENNKFEIPKFLIEQEAKYIAAQSGVDFDKIEVEDEKKKYIEQAERNSRLSLVLDSVRESEPDSVLNDVEAHNYLEQHVRATGRDPKEILKNQAQTMMLLSSIKDEFTLQWVADKANIIES